MFEFVLEICGFVAVLFCISYVSIVLVGVAHRLVLLDLVDLRQVFHQALHLSLHLLLLLGQGATALQSEALLEFLVLGEPMLSVSLWRSHPECIVRWQALSRSRRIRIACTTNRTTG